MNTHTTDKLVVKNLYKIFGEQPAKALSLLKQGVSKEAVLEQTGQITGVDDVSFNVRAGEIFVIMGLSGSGKSTVIRLLNRLVEPTDGHVLIDGQDIAGLSKQELLRVRREQMSMVFQSFALLPNRTVVDNVAFGLEVAGVKSAARAERAMQVLQRVGLERFAGMLPSQLSGGMQQRVGLARALCVNPQIVLMDEAFSALDPLIRKEMQDELLRLQATEQRTIIFISHDIEEALHIGTRIAIMKDGRVVQVGTPLELVRAPANEYVRNFFKSVDLSRYLTARDLAQWTPTSVLTLNGHASLDTVRAALHSQRSEYGYLCGSDKKFVGVVSALSVSQAGEGNLAEAILTDAAPISIDLGMRDLMRHVAAASCPVPVIDEQGCFCGTVSQSAVLSRLQ